MTDDDDVPDEFGWTPRQVAAEISKENALIERGQCPWSGLSIKACQAAICDCWLPTAE